MIGDSLFAVIKVSHKRYQAHYSTINPFTRPYLKGGGGGEREFDSCLGEVGNLNRKYQVFPEECKCHIFEYESFKVK